MRLRLTHGVLWWAQSASPQTGGRSLAWQEAEPEPEPEAEPATETAAIEEWLPASADFTCKPCRCLACFLLECLLRRA